MLKSAISAVTGGILTAIFLRHNTETAEFEKIKAGQFKEVTNELLKSGKMTYTEYYKANNFLSVAQKADEYYSEMNHNENGSKSYDFDWFIRFYESVGNISDEEMQDLWARILAGEINNPSTFSLKIIDILKNLRKKDAELFDKICSHSIHFNGIKYILPNYEEFLEHCNIKYSDIVNLSEFGLINSSPLLVYKINITASSKVLAVNNSLLITGKTKNEMDKILEIQQFPITTVGNEIASLKKRCISDENLILFAKQLKDNDINIEVHRIIKKDGNNYSFQLENLIADKI